MWDVLTPAHMGGCLDYGPFLGTLNIRCLIIINRDPKGTIILTTTHIGTFDPRLHGIWVLGPLGHGLVSRISPCT